MNFQGAVTSSSTMVGPNFKAVAKSGGDQAEFVYQGFDIGLEASIGPHDQLSQPVKRRRRTYLSLSRGLSGPISERSRHAFGVDFVHTVIYL